MSLSLIAFELAYHNPFSNLHAWALDRVKATVYKFNNIGTSYMFDVH